MTEKRFTALGDTHIQDNTTGKEFYAPCEWELLDLLNKLNNENEQLKSELKALRKKYNDFSDAVDKRLQEMDKGLLK